MFIFLSLVMGNGSWQAITPNRTMYLECDVKGLPNNIPYQIFWTKEGMSLKDLNSHGRINYFPNSKNLQIVRARKNAHQTLWNLVAILKFWSSVLNFLHFNPEPSDAGKYECNILLEVGSPAQQQVSITKEIYGKELMKLTELMFRSKQL